jgi:hypothetical protein
VPGRGGRKLGTASETRPKFEIPGSVRQVGAVAPEALVVAGCPNALITRSQPPAPTAPRSAASAPVIPRCEFRLPTRLRSLLARLADRTGFAFRQPAPVENSDDEISRNLLNQRDEPAKFHQNNAPSDAEAPPMGVQKQSLHLQLVSPNSGFRARVQKECGPITFPALYRHCVASFRVRHR